RYDHRTTHAAGNSSENTTGNRPPGSPHCCAGNTIFLDGTQPERIAVVDCWRMDGELIGYVPPAEFEEQFYREQAAHADLVAPT
ncbi:MAG TPA: hypothetical protein VGD56_09080, partial [Gemmatirosa sp.]